MVHSGVTFGENIKGPKGDEHDFQGKFTAIVKPYKTCVAQRSSTEDAR